MAKILSVKNLLIILTYGLFLMIIIAPLVKIFQGSVAGGWEGMTLSLIRPESQHAFYMSGLIVLIVTVLNTVFGILLSLYLARGTWLGKRAKDLINSLVDLPFAVSPVIGGLMIILLFGPQTTLGAFLEGEGIKIVFALPGMVIATLFVTFPLIVREVVPVLVEVGTTQEEAAYTMGASAWKTFWSVTWPSIQWGVIYGVALTVARSLGEFGAVLVVSGNIINRTQTATTLVYQDVDNFNLIGANSVALVLVSISIVILLLLEWAKRKAGTCRAN